MTTSALPKTDETPQWDPPCVTCSAPIGVKMREGYYPKQTQCPQCSGKVDQKRLEASGVPKLFIEARASLATFEARGVTCLERAMTKAREFIAAATTDALLFDRVFLVLSGTEGSGKSHLAAAIAMATLVDGRRSVRYVTFDQLLVEILEAYREDSEAGALAVTQRYTKEAFLLVIDDLGVEPPTQHAIQILYRILNARLNERLPTVITTNYPQKKEHTRKGQPTLGERLAERLTDDTPVRRILDRINGEARYEHLDVPSYRRAGKK